jgi:DNA invertase Pin-like site-specific DNA recombinase
MEVVMKSLITSFAIAFILAAPAASFAQASRALTRTQVSEQIAQIEKAGYTPGATDAYAYPENIMGAEARVAAQKDTARNSDSGTVVKGTPELRNPPAR